MPPNTLFPASARIDPAAPPDSRADFRAIPAKCAVYLLTGPNPETAEPTPHPAPHPYLLATVGNLRAALERRLADTPPDAHSKRIQYGQVCTQVHYRIVHSPFAANFWYARAARSLFPKTYRELLPFQPAWWIAVEKSDPFTTPFPKLRRTQDLTDPSLQYAGPIRDKSAAGKLIETLEDLFDLCRYHHILLQAPKGKPCAYKEMGKCPAPCDGTVPLSGYSVQMAAAFSFLAGRSRESWKSAAESEMKSAAAALRFEQAARIKDRLARASFIETAPFAQLGSLDDFSFLTLQPGPGKPWIEPWLIHPAIDPPIQPLPPPIKKKDLAAAAETLFARCRELAAIPVPASISPIAAEQLSLLSHHLFKGDADPGIYLRLSAIAGPQSLLTAAATFFARKSPAKPLPETASDTLPIAPNAAQPPPDLPEPQ